MQRLGRRARPTGGEKCVADPRSALPSRDRTVNGINEALGAELAGR